MCAQRFLSSLIRLLCMLKLVASSSLPGCKHIPGDHSWPSIADWASFNNSIGGRLVATVPQADVCHPEPFGVYNETTCQTLANQWGLAQTFEPHPAAIMNAYFQNQSCDPFTPKSRICELGNYAVYSVNVSSADDVIASIRLATERNLRLVTKNTGHESSGKGALSLWTGNLKKADVIPNYSSTHYTGPAIRLGSGMIAGDAYAVAFRAGYRMIGAECASVGVATGYTQGGGHSLLISEYGMASDQVLEWEIVTPTGNHIVATPEQNADLYWALCGGGGGAWGVVLSMTARIYRDVPVAGGMLAFANTNDDQYWGAIGRLFQLSPTLVDANNSMFFSLAQTGFDAISISLPGQSTDAVKAIMQPVIADLTELNLTYSFNVTYSSNYYEHFNRSFGPLPYGDEPISASLSNRLIPRSIIESDNATDKLIDAFRAIVKDGEFFFGCFFMNASSSSHPDNAVLPAWRSASIACNVNALWNYTAPLQNNLALKRRLVEDVVPAIEAVTPGGGMYINEMDPWYRGDWKANLYGENYERLLAIKHQYDPFNVFWGNFSVASDELFLDDAGRLCPS